MKFLDDYGKDSTSLESYIYCFDTIEKVTNINGQHFYIKEKVFSLPNGEWRYGDPMLQPPISYFPTTTSG